VRARPHDGLGEASVGPGQRLDLAVDASNLHYFDPVSGHSIGLAQA
jgi:hypothetical protein